MKTTPKLVAVGLTTLLLAGMARMLVIQQQTLNRVRQQNDLLQQQVDGLIAQANQLAEDNDRVSKLLTAQEARAVAPLAREQVSELLRLRGDVGRLRLQERELEQSRRDQMQTAQARLAKAESELARVTELHSENLVGAAQLEQARSGLELLKAQAKGDTAEVARIRLRQAEAELARAAELRKESLISEMEYEKAVRKVESAKAGAER